MDDGHIIILYWKAIKVMIFYIFNNQNRWFIRLHKYYRILQYAVLPIIPIKGRGAGLVVATLYYNFIIIIIK